MAHWKILIVDDDRGVRFGVRESLEAAGYQPVEAGTAAEALEAFRADPPDAAIVDYELPDGNALDLLPRLRAMHANVPIIILTGHGSIELAVRAIQDGADQFLTKPVDMQALRVILDRLIETRRALRRQEAARTRPASVERDPFAGTSAAVRQLADEARQALTSDSPVLIRGETGSGKGVLAAWLHRRGTRADEPFVDLNCAGFSLELLDSELFGHEKGAYTGATASKPGLLEIAHRGTVFLDEIGDMAAPVQAKLLKVLEEKRFRRLGELQDRHVDIRLIAATHQNLSGLIRDGRFREDLYYRIAVIPLRIPPLRERPEDIPALATIVLERLSAETGRLHVSLDAAAMDALCAHAWPGNVRELRNALERALLRVEDGVIERRHLVLGEAMAPGASGNEIDLPLEEIERRHIARVLEAEGGHVERAARRLGVPRSSLYNRIKQLGIPSGR